MHIHNTALTMEGKNPNWLLGSLIPTTYILGGAIIISKTTGKMTAEAHRLNYQMVQAGLADADAFVREVSGETTLKAAVRSRLETGFKDWNGG